MAALRISKSLEERLKALAARENRSVDDLLVAMIEEHFTTNDLSASGAQQEANPLLIMAEQAQKLGLSSGQSNISERSREILNVEFADYLKSRMDRDESTPD